MPAFCLSIHAQYQCRHAGACCQNWTVPAEPAVVRLVEQRDLRRPGMNGPLFVSSRKPNPAAAWDVARDNNGNCVFFEQDAGRLCLIHRAAGADALPSACRHFPRTILTDPRGTFISLSHFCPTAAGLLTLTQPLEVVDARPPLMLTEPIEGLEAREALPPLLRPGVLCDLQGFAAWERAAIETLGRADLTWRDALDRIRAATEEVRGWQPQTGPLTACVADVFRERASAPAPIPRDEDLVGLVARLAQSDVGNDLQPIDDFERVWKDRMNGVFDRYDTAMKNFLAARLFANWIAYQGRGLRSIVHWVRTAAALVRYHMLRSVLESGHEPAAEQFTEAVRTTDLLLLHVIDTQAFADAVAGLA